MPRIVLVGLLVFAVCRSVLAQAVPDGEIAGSITVRGGGVAPGVRVEIRGNDGVRREKVTDANGRFEQSGLVLGTYRVTAELTGFIPASGWITLSQGVPRAHLAWTLDVGCLSESVRVTFSPRDAAPIVDAIVHVRLISAEGPLAWSTRPECEGTFVQSYTARLVRRIGGQADQDGGTLRIFLASTGARLQPGAEYVALLWTGGLTDDGLVLPVEAGRVGDAVPAPLGGMPVEQAMDTLAQWARERRR